MWFFKQSLRVWNIEKDPCDFVSLSTLSIEDTKKDGFQFASVMYGHTARIWDCHIDSEV